MPSKTQTIDAAGFVQGDLVWAKLRGYPWWPSVVCSADQVNSNVLAVKRKNAYVVRFMRDLNYSWVEKTSDSVQPFRCDSFDKFSSHPEVRSALQMALEAEKNPELISKYTKKPDKQPSESEDSDMESHNPPDDLPPVAKKRKIDHSGPVPVSQLDVAHAPEESNSTQHDKPRKRNKKEKKLKKENRHQKGPDADAKSKGEIDVSLSEKDNSERQKKTTTLAELLMLRGTLLDAIGKSSLSIIATTLKQLASCHFSLESLLRSGIGKIVNKLKKHEDADVSQAATSLFERLQKLIKKSVESGEHERVTTALAKETLSKRPRTALEPDAQTLANQSAEGDSEKAVVPIHNHNDDDAPGNNVVMESSTKGTATASI